MNRILLLALLFICQFALAAENDLPAQDDTDAAQQDSAPNSDSADDGSDLIAAEIEESNDANDAEDEGSVRFIPTEQISQDLGVSFPVDI